jgi:hypothetical protein
MRWLKALCVGLVAAAVSGWPASAQETDDWLKPYAVTIYRTGYTGPFGTGIYLGNGVVLTAAHVAGLGIWRRPLVDIAGLRLPTSVIKDGHFHHADLELLGIDQAQLPMSIALRRVPLCKEPATPGQPVIVVAPKGVTRSRVVPPEDLANQVSSEFRTAIVFVPKSGNSGSGVFAANKKCLLGMITRQITLNTAGNKNKVPIAKYFIPAADIAAFIPPSVKF